MKTNREKQTAVLTGKLSGSSLFSVAFHIAIRIFFLYNKYHDFSYKTIRKQREKMRNYEWHCCASADDTDISIVTTLLSVVTITLTFMFV